MPSQDYYTRRYAPDPATEQALKAASSRIRCLDKLCTALWKGSPAERPALFARALHARIHWAYPAWSVIWHSLPTEQILIQPH